MKAAFTKLADIKGLATDTMCKFYWFGYLIMEATDEINRTVNNLWNPYWTKSQGQAMKSGVQHDTAIFNAIRKTAWPDLARDKAENNTRQALNRIAERLAKENDGVKETFIE